MPGLGKTVLPQQAEARGGSLPRSPLSVHCGSWKFSTILSAGKTWWGKPVPAVGNWLLEVTARLLSSAGPRGTAGEGASPLSCLRQLGLTW